jgi:hypothetical protein
MLFNAIDLKMDYMPLKILLFSWNEAYIHLLSKTGFHFDVVEVKKNGRDGWIEAIRPVPLNCGLITEADAHAALKAEIYDWVICQNINDLLFVREYHLPKVLLIQNKLSGLISRYSHDVRDNIRGEFERLIESVESITLVYDSDEKMDEWRYEGHIVLPGIDCNEYLVYRGNHERVLTVDNGFSKVSTRYLRSRVLRDIMMTTIGYNPEISESYMPSGWEEYKSFLQGHRVFFNTATENDHFSNVFILEAMATGMPVVSMDNSNAAFTDGDDGFVSGNIAYVKGRLEDLLRDADYAKSVGQRGKDKVLKQFSIEEFVNNWKKILKKRAAI